jgi:hypothetical protein
VSQGRLHTFASLREDVDFVEIPIIQRDYAQGRDRAADVREGFLTTLREALRPNGTPLDLDFIYGSLTKDGARRLSVLDGQQRLTTLFLLHWYTAASDGRSEDFRKNWSVDGRSRFSYSMRPSAAEFLDGLIRDGVLPSAGDSRKVSKLIGDSRWFFEAWRRDPTVNSCLVMLDAIHAMFHSEAPGGYTALIEQRRVSFHYLNLPDFGLGDDLYIKMNARGKALTPFENFKSWLVERGKAEPCAETFSSRLDQQWLDFFWSLVGRSGSDGAGVDFGEGFLRFFYLRAFFDSSEAIGAKRWLNTEDRQWLARIREARGYFPLRDLESHNVLPPSGFPGVLRVLDFLCDPRGTDHRQTLTNALASRAGYEEQLQLYALFAFLQSEATSNVDDESHAFALTRWRRVTTNLICNSRIDDVATAVSMVRGLKEIAANSFKLLEAVATQPPIQFGFSKDQATEEGRKAELILRDPDWELPIVQAERHWYLQGRIGFLLDLATSKGGAIDRERFTRYVKKFAAVVTKEILGSEQFLLQRALLSLYDFLPEAGSNHTFCVANATTYRDRQENWLRVFQDERFGEFMEAIGDDGPASLQRLIANSKASGWRRHVVAHPEMIAYCKMRLVRKLSDDEVLLLSKSRPSGYFAEAYSFALYFELIGTSGGRNGVKLLNYQYVYDDDWPAVRVQAGANFTLKFRNGSWECFGDDGKPLTTPESLQSILDEIAC